jgi:uncharacterized membrane protein
VKPFLQRFLELSIAANIRGLKSIAVALCFGITLCLAGIANAQNAQIVTYSWTGTIDFVSDDGTGIYTGTEIGDTFSGTFTYDPDVANIDGLDTSDGDSIIESSDVWVEYFLGSDSATITDGTIQQIANDAALSITTDDPIVFEDPGDEELFADLFGHDVAAGTLLDVWGLDFGDGTFEFEIAYASLVNMQDDLSFRPTPPWSPPGSPDDPDNQIAIFLISEETPAGEFFAYGTITMAEVQAGYDFELIDYPGTVLNTQVFGINDRGNVVGNGDADPDTYPFVYASKKGRFTDVAPLAGYSRTAVLGINDSGVMVGSVDNLDETTTSGFIRDKKGNFTVFSHPDADLYTQARGVNNKGLVTGFRDTLAAANEYAGFIYDPKNDTFTDIIPPGDHFRSIAHGINSAGVVVGSAFFFGADDPCNPGNTGFYQRYGWRRATDGTVTYFSVNGSSRTAARGINDSETIVGLVRDPNDNNRIKGFKVTLDGSQCQEFTVVARDLLEFPGFDSLYPEGITNSGVIVGGVDEFITSGLPPSHGFIATPDKKGKK